jgi:single-strand DNA-binding protein
MSNATAEAPAKKRNYDTNEWKGSGNLGRDPEFKYLQNGTTAVVKFSIGVAMFRPQDGDKGTTWVDIVAYGDLAETINNTLKKGDKVDVKARLNIRPYTDKDGNKRKSVEMVAFEAKKHEFGNSAKAAPAASSLDDSASNDQEIDF